MSTSIATSISPILGVTPAETYALTLLSFGSYESIKDDLLGSLEKKKYIDYKDKKRRIVPHLTEKAHLLLATFHR